MTEQEVRAVLGEQSKQRPLRTLFYLLLGGAGGVLVYDPTRALADQSPWIRWAWGSFLAAGAALSVSGASRGKWVVEWLGLPLLGTALVALSAILFALGTTGGMAFGMLVLALFVVLVSRALTFVRLAQATLAAKRAEAKRIEEARRAEEAARAEARRPDE